MIARHRKSIYKLTQLLRALESNPSDCDLLLRLQWELIARIRRTERRIAKLKERKQILGQEKKYGRHSKAISQTIKQEIASLSVAISHAQWVLFVWRCFGDGIAFIYLDKYALKHMLYNTDDSARKQSAGTLSNKDGFKREWLVVRQMRNRQIPAMLCDITNTLRHGDVCILTGPDPIPIEIKSSSNRNARVDRQESSLKILREFFETDEASNFRGMPRVKRVALPVSAINHASIMNECIELSRASGCAVRSPEDGITYACLRSPDALDQLTLCIDPRDSQQMITLLNGAKTEASWMPYYPFTLSIREPHALYEFINGDVTLAVILNASAVINVFESKGLQAQFVDHPEWILLVSRPNAQRGKDVFVGISTHFFARLFYEFEPIGPLADIELAHIRKLEAEAPRSIDDGQLKSEPGKFQDFPAFKPMRWSTIST